jgi:formamidopyrimidine-DNA glycosylase
MPELPEVEYAARSLRGWLNGKKITAAAVPPSKVAGGDLAHQIVGRTVTSIERRGKWMRLHLSGGSTLYSHLGMTGKWVKRRASDGPERFERARIDVRGASARYLDMRMFGRLRVLPKGETLPRWGELGPDPLVDGIDVDALQARLGRTRRSIKETLLDQTVLAGVGNIQASEALWRAKIHPGGSAQAVARDRKRVAALAKGIRDSIDYTLRAQGPEDEITYVEEPGSDNPFKVYDRGGAPCPRCKTKIRRVVQGGRSTYYCPHCQPR